MAQTSSLPTYSAIYSFGDSLSDAGNLSILTSTAGATEPVSPPYHQEQYGPISGNVFSNGPTWVQDLSITLGLGTLAPTLAGGTDFAFGGAETGATPQNADDPKIQALSLPAQIATFQAAVSSPSASALYTLSIGSNDLIDILSDPSLTAQQQTTDVNDAVANEITFVKQLVADGAKNLLVLNVPDLGKTPDVTSGLANGSGTPSAAFDAQASQLSSAYDSALTTQLGTIGSAAIHVVDAYQLVDNAVADPAAYGLTNTTSPVWSGSYTSASSGTLAATDPATQDQYLFWDHLHPTEAGHQALAEAAEQQLSGTAPLTVTDTTTNQPVAAVGQPYTGPVGALQQQYLSGSSDNLNVTATTPDWYILTGGGEDAITVSSGTNVLDGGSGSNFLTGGSGQDTFFVDERSVSTALWDTVNDFHAGDAVTIWGMTPSQMFSWWNNLGAAGYTGLTLLTQPAPDAPNAALTLSGYTTADLSDGKLTLAYGTDAGSGNPYLYIQGH
jgi:phospholipase/lecithinase/hemolysin